MSWTKLMMTYTSSWENFWEKNIATITSRFPEIGYANLVSCVFSEVVVCLSVVGEVKYCIGLGSVPLQVKQFIATNLKIIS